MQIKDCCVDQGGLMRCCLETLDDKCEQEIKYGDIILCKYCSSTMIVEKTKSDVVLNRRSKTLIIRWNHPETKE